MAVLDAVIERRVRHAVEVLSRSARVKAAYVFGSQAEGTAEELSDIDVAVFIENLEDWDLRRRAKIAGLVQKEVGDAVEIHFFSAMAFHHPEPASFAAYILQHGIPIALG